MTATDLLLLAIAAFSASLVLCGCALLGLRRWRVVDIPNDRSSHAAPIPRGGGIGFVLVILGFWAAMSVGGMPALPPPMLAGALAVALISFADDLSSVSRLVRIAVQALAVAVALAFLPLDRPILMEGLPLAVDRAIVGLAWLWFLNLYNFMDGIDGIAAVEGMAITFGIAAIAIFAGESGWPVAPALVTGAAVAGFLPYNLPRARLFMGDVGSVTLGYLIGWLLILVAAEGALATAILLALYFVLDATTTLVHRLAIGETVLKPHRRHAYQRATDRGLRHAAVSAQVGVVGIMLAVLGMLALAYPLPALLLGVLLVAGFIVWLRYGPPRPADY